jgi:hypothetical protein
VKPELLQTGERAAIERPESAYGDATDRYMISMVKKYLIFNPISIKLQNFKNSEKTKEIPPCQENATSAAKSR